MKILKKVILAGIAILLLTTTTACGTHSVSTAADQVGLHYKGGPFSNKAYANYIPSSTKAWYGPGDTEYLYPNNQRSYDATGGKGAESAPITSVSKDQAEVAVPVSVTFRLKNDEKSLRKFHENIGNRYHAYMDGDSTTEGWKEMLGFYIGQPLNVALDREVQQYDWRDLYSKAEVRTSLQDLIQKQLPDLVKQKLQGDYFDDFQVQVQQPTPTNQALKDAIAQQQSNIAAAQSAKAKAEADIATARAQTALANAQAAQQQATIKGYGGFENYNKAQAVDKGLNPYQPTYIVPGTKP